MARDRQQRAGAARSVFSRSSLLVVVLLLTIAAFPFRTHMVGMNASFMPAFIASVLATDIFTAVLLFQQYRVNGRSRLLVVGVAYAYSAACIVPHGLAFPGVVSANGPLATAPSNATWLWVAWHVGFAVILTAGLLAEPLLARCRTCRTVITRWSVVAIFAFVGAFTTLLVKAPNTLPAVISGNNYSYLLDHFGWLIIGSNVLAVAVTYWKTRHDSNIERWILVAISMNLADVVLTLFADSRFTFGWYSARAFSAISSAILLFAIVSEVTELYRRGERDKRALEDEALGLLREKRTAQYREDRVRRILENAADGYVEISRSGIIQGWNGKSGEMFGWSADEAIDRSAVDLLAPTNSSSAANVGLGALWDYDGRFEGVRAEYMVRHRAGHMFPVEMAIWVDESGLEPRMCAFIRDITMRRDAEEKMARALADERQAVMRLQEIDKAKSDFVSSISHELRSPLTSTLGYLEILSDGGAGDLNPEQSHMVEVADRNAKRLKALIEDLLTLSRIESGAFGVKFRPVDISSVVAQAIGANASFAQERGVIVTTDIDDVLGICPGDDTQIARAIGNIVNNAVKFTPPTGKIRISAHAEDNHVIIDVNDDGIGVPEQEMPQLFERFFRSSLSIDQQHQGAGLGLTITKAIVDHHGGSIDFKSTEGSGTQVRLRLPMLQSVEPAEGTGADAAGTNGAANPPVAQS